MSTRVQHEAKAPLTWRERTLIAILMLIARMLADEQWVHQEVKTLATHINVEGKRDV